jgi:hypothetical protein
LRRTLLASGRPRNSNNKINQPLSFIKLVTNLQNWHIYNASPIDSTSISNRPATISTVSPIALETPPHDTSNIQVGRQKYN